MNITVSTSTYPGYTWPLTQHMGVINESNLYPILWAADNFSTQDDPILRINEYLVANSVLTPNVRHDSGEADVWRDYQQILSELGLIYSTEIIRTITLTPLGVAFLDKIVSFSELMILQVFRYQYPNGHKIAISSSLRSDLVGSPFESYRNLVQVQESADVQIRPAVLLWRVLRGLQHKDSLPEEWHLTQYEFINFAMECTNQSQVNVCIESIINHRSLALQPTIVPNSRKKRNMQDWIKFLAKTPLFVSEDKKLRISYEGIAEAENIDSFCDSLEQVHTFWKPGALDKQNRENWYSFFGSLDLGIPLRDKWTLEETDVDNEKELYHNNEVRNINLQSFDPSSLRGLNIVTKESKKINSSYDAESADSQHRLHDRMVAQIGEHYENLGATVYFDPKTIDILAQFDEYEVIVEVKSVTSKNVQAKIRTAIGQLLYYDYLRSKQSAVVRRKAIALTAKVPNDSWYVDFLNNFLNVELISLEGQNLIFFPASYNESPNK